MCLPRSDIKLINKCEINRRQLLITLEKSKLILSKLDSYKLKSNS